MEVTFADADLDRLETDARFDAGFSAALVKSYRKRLQAIRAAIDERAFYAMNSMFFKKLKGEREDQYLMRLNDQWRLILELHGSGPNKAVRVIAIEDYH